MARLVDPMRRALPVSEWPQVDQVIWAAALTKGYIFDEGGGAAHWASRTRQTNVQHYGRWLGYLLWTSQLDQSANPADRVTRETVRAYNRHLETIVAPRTRLSMLVGLKVMMQAIVPDRSWRWLQDACNRVQINAKPSRAKRARMRPTAEIFAAALTELEQLPRTGLSLKQALAYRDALMLALLAARPLRVKNFSALALRRHLVDLEGGWLITIPADETKTRQSVSFELPKPLLPWFERYLSELRPLFPHAAESSRLWLGKEGVMRDPHAVYHRITRLTRRLFGTPINPHLLRDCAASSLAAVSADMARAAAPLLGHRSFSTTERYYIQADNLAASRRHGATLDRLKAATEDLALSAPPFTPAIRARTSVTPRSTISSRSAAAMRRNWVFRSRRRSRIARSRARAATAPAIGSCWRNPGRALSMW